MRLTYVLEVRVESLLDWPTLPSVRVRIFEFDFESIALIGADTCQGFIFQSCGGVASIMIALLLTVGTLLILAVWNLQLNDSVCTKLVVEFALGVDFTAL